MSFTVSSAIADMQQELNIIGQQVDDGDFILFLNRANDYFSSAYQMPTTQREQDLLLYAGVKEYGLPSDFQAIIEPKRPYAFHSPDFNHQTEKSLIHWPYGYKTAIKWDRETPFLVVNVSDAINTFSTNLINPLDSLTAEGTVTVGGDGSGLLADTQIFVQGTASVRFTVTGSGGTTTITVTGMTSMDLSEYLTDLLGKFFVDLQSPSTNTVDISSVVLNIGSDASNYYSMTATTRFRGDTISTGWGQIDFDPYTATQTGTPDATAITFASFVITHGVTGVNGLYRIDNFMASRGVYFQLPYYSLHNVKATDGTYKELVTLDTDTMLCPPGATEAYTYKTLELISASPVFNNAAFASYCARELGVRENNLKTKFPKQEVQTSSIWYRNQSRF